MHRESKSIDHSNSHHSNKQCITTKKCAAFLQYKQPAKSVQGWHYRAVNRFITVNKTGEDGRIFLLSFAMLALVLTIVMATVSMSELYLKQKRLQRFTDQALTLASTDIPEELYMSQGVWSARSLEIEQTKARDRVQTWLAEMQAEELSGLEDMRLEKLEFRSDTELSLTLKAQAPLKYLPQKIANLTSVSLQATAVGRLKSAKP